MHYVIIDDKKRIDSIFEGSGVGIIGAIDITDKTLETITEHVKSGGSPSDFTCTPSGIIKLIKAELDAAKSVHADNDNELKKACKKAEIKEMYSSIDKIMIDGIMYDSDLNSQLAIDMLVSYMQRNAVATIEFVAADDIARTMTVDELISVLDTMIAQSQTIIHEKHLQYEKIKNTNVAKIDDFNCDADLEAFAIPDLSIV